MTVSPPAGAPTANSVGPAPTLQPIDNIPASAEAAVDMRRLLGPSPRAFCA